MFHPTRDHRNQIFNPYFGSKIRKETLNYENYMKWNGGGGGGGGVEFRPDVKEDEHGICSPPLWEKQSAPGVHSQLIDNVSLNLSPPSRRDALHRGKLELMEMVKAMPESSYELSLKDLVDNFHKPEESVQEECFKQQGAEKIKRKPKMGSNLNEINKGLFLKMVLPLPFGASSKKKVKNPYARVMPKPSTTEQAAERSLKCVDKEWWKKKTSSDDNDSGGLSGSSGSSASSHSSGSSTRSPSTRNKTGCLQGFSALYLKKSKSAK